MERILKNKFAGSMQRKYKKTLKHSLDCISVENLWKKTTKYVFRCTQLCMCDPNPSLFHMVVLTSKIQYNSTVVLQLNPPHLPLCSRGGRSYTNTTPPPRQCRSGFLTLCQPRELRRHIRIIRAQLRSYLF